MTVDAYEAIEALAIRDHKFHTGKVILCHQVTGYNEHDDLVDVVLDPPARMRVCKAVNEDLQHWVDEWLDPYWDVEPLEDHPALKNIRSLWVFGPSYCTDGCVEPSTEWELENTGIIQKAVDAIREVFHA